MSRRVVHITTVHPLRDPRIFRKQVPSLAGLGYDVHLIARDDDSILEESDGKTTHEADKSKSGHESGQTFAIHRLATKAKGTAARLALARQAYRLALGLRADVYHIHDPELLPVLKLLKVRTGARVIYDMHEDYGARGGIAGRFLRGLERWACSWLDQVLIADDAYRPILASIDVPVDAIYNFPLAQSHRNSGDQSEHSGETAESSESAPDTVADLKFSAAPKDFRLIYTGVLSESRGLFDMIRLAEAIDDAALPWAVDLVGVCYIEADRRAADARLAPPNEIDSLRRVGWDRYVDADAIEPYVQAAAVGLIFLHPHPNYINVLPTKLYEYLQCGLPVLCSDLPRMSKFVAAHNCGAVVDPADTEAIVALLREWSSNPDVYRTLSLNARTASANYVWTEMEERLRRIYERLV